MKLIAPSILSADFSKLSEEIKAVESAGADWIHVDVMDGHFVPNITIGPLIVEAARRVTTLPLDVHLMIEDPDQYLEAFARAGSTYLTVHPEACYHLHRSLQAIKDLGSVRGRGRLDPATPLSALEWVLEDVDPRFGHECKPGFRGTNIYLQRHSQDKRSQVHGPFQKSRCAHRGRWGGEPKDHPIGVRGRRGRFCGRLGDLRQFRLR